MKVKVESENPNIFLKDIIYINNKYNISIPKSYIDFLLETNGGFVDINYHFVASNSFYSGVDFDVHSFYSLQSIMEFLEMEEPDEDIYPDYLIYNKILKDNKILIAEDASNNEICIDVSYSENNGKVYILDQNSWDIELISNSFEEFINNFIYEE